jgi:hypothetical protein
VPSRLSIGEAFRYAFDRLATRGGGLLLVAYLLVQMGAQVTMQSFFAALFEGRLPAAGPGAGPSPGARAGAEQAFPLALDLPAAVSGVLSVLLMFAGIVLSIVAMRAFYRDIDDVPTAEHTRRLPRTVLVTLVVSVLVSLAVMVGFVLLIVPGIFLAVSFAFATLVVAVEDAGVLEALKRSWALSSGNRIRLFVLGVILVVVSMLFSIIFTALELVSPLAGDLAGAVVSALMGLFGIALLVGAYRQLAEEDVAAPSPTSRV